MNKLDILQLSMLQDLLELRLEQLKQEEEQDNEYNIKTYTQILLAVQSEILQTLFY